jgi:hypothetical protein
MFCKVTLAGMSRSSPFRTCNISTPWDRWNASKESLDLRIRTLDLKNH